MRHSRQGPGTDEAPDHRRSGTDGAKRTGPDHAMNREIIEGTEVFEADVHGHTVTDGDGVGE